MHNEHFGAYGALAALGAFLVAKIAAYDAFLHGMASLLACFAAAFSIIYTIKNNRRK